MQHNMGMEHGNSIKNGEMQEPRRAAVTSPDHCFEGRLDLLRPFSTIQIRQSVVQTCHEVTPEALLTEAQKYNLFCLAAMR